MLKKLLIDQFVIIEHLDLDLNSGLTILTGDTGAGKSILLDAMGLILGDSFKPDSIRHGSDQSIIEAHIAPPEAHPVWTLLSAQGLNAPAGKEFKIRRIIKRDGGNEITLNDTAIDIEFLQKIGVTLIEIHGQFANQSLLEPDNQLTLLDLSGNFPPEVFKNVADALAEVQRLTQELDEEKLFLAKHKSQLPKIEEIVTTLSNLGMDETYVADVQAEHDRLRTAKETCEAFQVILGQLIAGNGINANLASINQTLARQENLDADKVAQLKEHLAKALEHARGAVKQVGILSPEYEIDTGPLKDLKEILATLHKIATEAGITMADLFGYYEEMSAKLARIQNGRARVAEIDQQLADAKNAYRHHAHVLSEKRVQAAGELSATITREFAPLKLEKAQFEVVVEEKQDIPWTERGLNIVTFTGRMNPGMPFSPIAETASGGELARMMLALKVVVQEVQTIPTLVFDEVDTGIGGSAAAAVGGRLAKLAETTQVLVITHSPQVASRGERHLHVSKKTDGETTTSIVKQLSTEARLDEISRMLSGSEITDESQAAAKRLLAEAASARA